MRAKILRILERMRLYPTYLSIVSEFLKENELRVFIGQKGFCVKNLAVHVGLDVRTLERRFGDQFHTTPKAWIMRERMSFAPSLLAQGLSNKQVAAFLSYSCEANFCRAFKRYFGCAPQQFARASFPRVSYFDNKLSCSDKPAGLPRYSHFEDSHNMETQIPTFTSFNRRSY